MAEPQKDRITPNQPERITPEDIEARFRGLIEDVEQRTQVGKQKAMPFVIGAGFLVLLLAYLLGKRVGRKKSTVVEIRRI
jgi:hypothetical protein